MRVAVLYWSGRKIGGTEAYLESIIAELSEAGHEVAFFHERGGPSTNERINLPRGVPIWCADEMGAKSALAALSSWSPDVLYTHCLMDLALEAETFKIAPAIFFAHAYYGTCISGNKSFRKPIARPCHRRFGWQCMVRYYPSGCGGSNPFTMVQEYQRQAQRLQQLKNYRAIVTHSTYMRDEYVKHGFDPQRVRCLSYYANQESGLTSKDSSIESTEPFPESLIAGDAESSRAGESRATWRLLFLGRMDRIKGGQLLIDALPLVIKALGTSLHVSFAGDGHLRREWEKRAQSVQAATPGLKIDFTGWVKGSARESLLDNSDLLVVPSVWPEPFGLVGPEAGRHGVPIVAFNVGGIAEWLSDGINGCMAPGEPPTAEGLAIAISECLRDPLTYARLQRGARIMAQRFDVQNHLRGLLHTFEQALTPDTNQAYS